ncbi:MAG: monofunctional biosynthetic peptidoglycan transglycosylase [Bacteroidaceae bacterium]|nr:monofunctional biosynthetic peptidoglycan transglycosylase [Bacteroidaceae bacterium]
MIASFFNKVWKFLKWAIIAFFGTSILAVVIYRWLPVPCSPLMFIRCGQQLKAGESLKLKHQWVPLDSISTDLPLAVWSSEDQNFLTHNGFDFGQIKVAVQDKMEGKRERGASTISQQTAKNVFLWPSHSWVRKGLEVYFTVLIETIWSKQRIMEVYLNTIEMGDGIYGAEAVALEHFGCRAKELTRNQCAMIAVSLPNPIRMNSASPSAYMYRRQSWVLRQMRYLGEFPMKEKNAE